MDGTFLTQVDVPEIQTGDQDGTGFTMDIMMMLDTEKVSDLRQEFEKAQGGLTLVEFVHVMIHFLIKEDAGALEPAEEKAMVANLCDLFAQIDVNGDGSMEWTEFTSFIVESGIAQKDNQLNAIQLYHQSAWEDPSKHYSMIDKLYYFDQIDKLVICETGCRQLKIYNARCQLQHTIERNAGIVLSATHLSSLNQYAIASSDLQLSIYDDSTYRLHKSFHTPTSQSCMHWYNENQTLFTSGSSGIIYAWDIEQMDERYHMGGIGRDGHLVENSHRDVVLDLLGLPTLESLASASMDRIISLWDVHTGKHKQRLEGHAKGVRSLAYSPEYRFLVSAGFDYDAIVWNPYVDRLILRLHGHTNSLCCVKIIPDTPQIITADVDGCFKVWDIRNFSCLQTFSAENACEIRQFVSVTPHKKLISAGKRFHQFEYEKLENPKLTDANPVFSALYNPTSMTFITASGSDVKIWDAKTGSILRVYRGLSSSDLTALCLDFRDRKFILADHDGRICVYDYQNGAKMKEFAYPDKAHQSEVSRLIYCNDYKTIISASWDLTINIHDESCAESGILLRQIIGGHTTDISALAYSPTLSLIATGSSDFTLQIWDFEFGSLDGTCIGHTSGITSLLFLDPFPLLLATDQSGNICIWAMRPSRHKLKCVARLKNEMIPHQHGVPPITCSAFLNDQLFTGDEKGYLALWDFNPLLRELKIKRLEYKVKCTNAKKNIRNDATEICKKIRNSGVGKLFQNRHQVSQFFFMPGTPLVNASSTSAKKHWSAHSHQIDSIQIIQEPLALLTASFDCLVKIWSIEGILLGTLLQGDISLSTRDWNFTVNVQGHEKRRMEHADDVIEKMKQLTLETAVKTEENRPATPVDLECTLLDASDLNFDIPALEPARKTPRRKPITPRNAGRRNESPRQQRLNLKKKSSN